MFECSKKNGTVLLSAFIGAAACAAVAMSTATPVKEKLNSVFAYCAENGRGNCLRTLLFLGINPLTTSDESLYVSRPAEGIPGPLTVWWITALTFIRRRTRPCNGPQ